MANTHYYSKNQDSVESKPNKFEYKFKEHKFIFHTDAGVFSKDFMDYGTYVMLNNFRPNDIDLPILDIGSGWGPIGIIVSRLYDRNVVQSEINERAYNLNKKNVIENNANCTVYNGDLYECLEGMRFSSVISNPPIRAGKAVVYAIYDGAYDHLEINGDLWVVIQKKQGAPSSKAYLESKFGNCEIVDRDGGYYILRSVKRM